MLKMTLLMMMLAVLVSTINTIERGRRQGDIQAQAMASRLLLIAEAAQRYATATRALRPGVAEAPITVQELIAENYLPVATSPIGPYGGPITLTARTGAYGNVVVDMAVLAPAGQADDLRLQLATIDRGGGQVSLQALNGSARFRMAASAALTPDQYVRFSGSTIAGQALGNDAVK